MSYTTRAQVEAKLPPQYLLEALDDDKDGEEDTGLFTAVQDGADAEVDGILGQRFTVPFTSDVPAIVPRAALVFLLETLYLRRGFHGENNPHTKAAAEMRTKLDRIARGEEPLAPEVQRARPSGTLISEPSRVYSANGTGVL